MRRAILYIILTTVLLFPVDSVARPPMSNSGTSIDSSGSVTTNGKDLIVDGSVAVGDSNAVSAMLISSVTSTRNEIIRQLEIASPLTTGYWNTIFGFDAGQDLTTGDSNTLVGLKAGYEINTGSKNAYFGLDAGNQGTGSSYNVSIGDHSMYYNIVGEYNMALGFEAMKGKAITLSTTLNEGAELSAADTTITLTSTAGMNSLGYVVIESEIIYHTGISGNDLTGCTRGHDGTTATTHADGTAVYYPSQPRANVAIGALAGRYISDGYSNSFIGYSSGGVSVDVTGYGNSCIGNNSCGNIGDGYQNNGYGMNALYSITTGFGNNSVGYDSGYDITTGDNNVIIGNFAGFNTGIDIDRCIFIGQYAGEDETNDDRLVIDNQNRTNLADQQAKAIIYGAMAAAPANQELHINASVIDLGDLPSYADNAAAITGGLAHGYLYIDSDDYSIKIVNNP